MNLGFIRRSNLFDGSSTRFIFQAIKIAVQPK